MDTLLVDPSWLVDSFEYAAYAGDGRSGQPLFLDPVTVTNCRFDFAPSFERDGKQVTKIGDATIFCYGAFTEGVPIQSFAERSKVIYDGKEYTIKTVRKFRNIASSGLFSVELVVI